MTHAMRKLGGMLFAAVSALAITASATTASALVSDHRMLKGYAWR